MHFSTLLSGVAMVAYVAANPVAAPGGGCQTYWHSSTATVTKTTTHTSTAPCPIVSIPIVSAVGVTGTIVPVQSITSDVGSIVKREPTAAPAAAPVEEREVEARNGKECKVTSTKWSTVTKQATTTVTAKHTGCPIVSA